MCIRDRPISEIYEGIFSEYSYGFRPGRSCHDAIRQALEYLNDGYEWVVDIDIEPVSYTHLGTFNVFRTLIIIVSCTTSSLSNTLFRLTNK